MIEMNAYWCDCGEEYVHAVYAWDCRKCRDYLHESDYDSRTVTVACGDVLDESNPPKIIAKLKTRKECEEF